MPIGIYWAAHVYSWRSKNVPNSFVFSHFEIITKHKQLVKTGNSKRDKKQKLVSFFCQITTFYGEFDPGSGRTLAACLTHASRTMKHLRVWISGERVRNT